MLGRGTSGEISEKWISSRRRLLFIVIHSSIIDKRLFHPVFDPDLLARIAIFCYQASTLVCRAFQLLLLVDDEISFALSASDHCYSMIRCLTCVSRQIRVEIFKCLLWFVFVCFFCLTNAIYVRLGRSDAPLVSKDCSGDLNRGSGLRLRSCLGGAADTPRARLMFLDNLCLAVLLPLRYARTFMNAWKACTQQAGMH